MGSTPSVGTCLFLRRKLGATPSPQDYTLHSCRATHTCSSAARSPDGLLSAPPLGGGGGVRGSPIAGALLKVLHWTVEVIEDYADRRDHVHSSNVDLQPSPSWAEQVGAKYGGKVGQGHLVSGGVCSNSGKTSKYSVTVLQLTQCYN